MPSLRVISSCKWLKKKPAGPLPMLPSTRAAFAFELAVAVSDVWQQLAGKIAVRPEGAKTGWDYPGFRS